MRIGMILDASFPPDPRVENEAVSLIQAGHELFLFSLDFTQKSGEEDYKGIHIVRYPAGKILHKLSALAYTFPFYSWQVSPLIAHFIGAHDIEVLHVHDMVIAEAAFDANKSYNLPIVLDLHENRPEIMKDYAHVNTISGKLLINLKRWSAKYYELASKAKCVIVVTEAAKRDILAKTNKESNSIAVVPNSVRPEEFLEKPIESSIVKRMEGAFNLLYIGDTSIRRGTDTAILAISILKEKIPEIKLWLIGKSSADGQLKDLVKKHNLDRHVVFEGWKSTDTFPSYLQSTHVALSPLKRNIHHDTTYANKLFQYMVCGKPIVVSNCTAQADLVKQEQVGLVHEASSAEDLAEKIFSLYSNENEASLMGERGKQAMRERWGWDLLKKQLVQLYAASLQ